MVGRHGALLSHLELAEYNADVNVEEVKDKSHSNVRGLINHLTSAIPAGKVPGGGQSSPSGDSRRGLQQVALPRQPRRSRQRPRQRRRNHRKQAYSAHVQRAIQPSGHDRKRGRATEQDIWHTSQVRLTTNNELRGQLPKEESFIDEANIPKKKHDPNKQEAYQFAKHSYWAESAQKHISNVTNVAKVIKDAYDGTFRDSK